MANNEDKFYESGPIESLNAPPPPPPPPTGKLSASPLAVSPLETAPPVPASAAPPPPPPPSGVLLPRKSPGDTDTWMRKTIDEIKSQPLPPGMTLTVSPVPGAPELVRQLAEHRSWLERLERDVSELKAARFTPPPSAVPAGMLAALSEPTPEPLAVEDARLRAELFQARAELERTKSELERARGEPRSQASSADVTALRSQLSAADKALDAVRSELRQLTEENEKLEGSLQALKLQADDSRAKTREAVAVVTDLKLDPKAEAIVQKIVVDRDKLQEEKASLEKDLGRLKSEAQKRLNSLKGEVEKATKLSETMRVQKENLLRQLQERDARGLGESGEITLEDITNSEIFKTMLGNIRRTSRAEVTTFHEAVASLKAIDPHAYEVVLEVVAKHFQKAQIENPLATLPRD